MFRRSRLHRAASTVATIALSLAGVIATAPAAQAVTSVEATAYGFNRTSANGHSLSIPSGTDAWVSSEATINPDWAGWPLVKATKISRSDLTISTLPTGLSFIDSSTATRNWSLEDINDFDGCNTGADTAVFTSVAADKCANWLWVGDQVGVTNTSDTALTVDSNANTQTLTRTVKKTTTTLNGQTGVDASFTAWISSQGTSDVTLAAATDSGLSVDFLVCLDETKFVAGDDLVVTPTIYHNGTPLTAGSDVSFYDYTNLDGDDDVTTYSAPDIDPFENLTLEFGGYLDVDVTDGTYAGSVTVTKGGTDVTEACPTGEPSYPTLSRHRGPQDDRWMFSSESYSLPSQLVDVAGTDDWNRYSRTSDGFGGVFYWGYESTDPEDMTGAVKVVHETATGPNNSLRGDIGYIPADSNEWGMVTVGRYGASGANWFAINRGDTGWTMKTGSMTGTAITTTTYTTASSSALCPKGYAAIELFANPTSTTNPVGELYCQNKKGNTMVVVSLTTTGLVPLYTLPAATSTAPCVDFSSMTEGRAANAEAAIQYYVTASAKGADKECGGVKGAVASRTIVAIGANATVTTKKLTKSPWGRSPEPESLEFGTRLTRGSWLGLASSYDLDTDTTVYGSIFTINVTTGITLEREINFTETEDFGMWSYLRLVDEYATNRMRVVMQGTIESDGEFTARYAVGHIDFRTDPGHPDWYGYVDFNDFADATGFGYYSGKMGALFSTSSDGTVHLFMRTSNSQYTVGSWGPAI